MQYDRRIFVRNSLKEIMNYSPDFNELTMNYFLYFRKKNYKNLKEFLMGIGDWGLRIINSS